MAPRPRNQDKDVEKQLKRAEAAGGWVVDYPSGHWGRLSCLGDESGEHCSLAISGTPRGSGHFRTVRATLRKCPHGHALT